MLVTAVVWVAAVVTIDQALPGAPIVPSILVAIGSLVWVSHKAHRLLLLSAPRIDEQLLSDDECWPDRVGEDFEPTDEELVEIEVIVGPPAESAGIDWTCTSCGEENEKEFGLCWKCGSGFTEEDDQSRSNR